MTDSDIVPPTNPPTQTFRKLTATEPRSPLALDQAPFIEGTHEENGRQKQTSENISQIDRPPPQQGERSADRGVTLFDNDPQDDQGTENTRARDGANARANHGRGVSAETGGRARGRRQIERDHIDARKEDLN